MTVEKGPASTRGWRWATLVIVGFLTIAGCRQALSPPANGGGGVLPAGLEPVADLPGFDPTPLDPRLVLRGQVDFSGRQTLVAFNMLMAATIALIDTTSNSTVATTVTSPLGTFTMPLRYWSPAVNIPYVLEATKRLNNNVPGNDNVSYRTLVVWDGSTWNAISTPSITIDALTTAIAIESALDISHVPPIETMGKVNSSVNPSVLNELPSFEPLHPDLELVNLANEIKGILAGNLDPVRSIEQITPVIAGLSADTALRNSILAINGYGFDPIAGNITVKINTATCSVLAANPRQIVVTVPNTATSGNVTVKTRMGTSNPAALTINVSPDVNVTYMSPQIGSAGTEVVIAGWGFSRTPSLNTVTFNGFPTYPASSDVNIMWVEVPAGGTTGPLIVTTPSGTASPLSFTVPNSVITPGGNATIESVFPSSASYGQDITITGTGFGSNPGVVTFLPNTAGSIESWSDTKIVTSQIANLTTTSPMNVYDGSSNLLASYLNFSDLGAATLEWKGKANALSSAHAGGWLARVGKYLYVGGGFDNGMGYTTTVERATFNADGSVGPFAVQTGIAMRHPAFGQNYAQWDKAHDPLVIGNYLYIFGGFDGNRSTDTIQRAPINSNGSLQNFTTLGQKLLQPVEYASVVREGDYVYVFGGLDTATGLATDSVQSAHINGDGTLGDFGTAGKLWTPGPTVVYAINGTFAISISGNSWPYAVPASITGPGTLGSICQCNIFHTGQWWLSAVVSLGRNRQYWLPTQIGADHANRAAVTTYSGVGGGAFEDVEYDPDYYHGRGSNALLFGAYIYTLGATDYGGNFVNVLDIATIK